MLKVKQLVLAGLLLAAIIVLVRFVSIQTPILRISFGFIPFILAGWLLGPVWGAAIGVASDLLGMLLFPTSGFFPGFTLNALLEGLVYGLFLYGRPVDRRLFVRLVISILLVHLVIQLALNTLWLSIMLKRAFIPLMATRVVTNVVRFPIELVTMFFLMRLIEKPVDKYLWNEPFADTGDEGEGGHDEDRAVPVTPYPQEAPAGLSTADIPADSAKPSDQ
jgi:ECF transporter S component (folate family)